MATVWAHRKARRFIGREERVGMDFSVNRDLHVQVENRNFVMYLSVKWRKIEEKFVRTLCPILAAHNCCPFWLLEHELPFVLLKIPHKLLPINAMWSWVNFDFEPVHPHLIHPQDWDQNASDSSRVLHLRNLIHWPDRYTTISYNKRLVHLTDER